MGSRTTVPPGTLVGLTSVFGMGTGEPHRYGRQTVGSTLGGYLEFSARRPLASAFQASAAASRTCRMRSEASRRAMRSCRRDSTRSMMSFMYIASCSISGESEIMTTS